jgi:hypothetical protein
MNKRILLEIAIARCSQRRRFATVLSIDSGPGHAALLVAIPMATFVIDTLINDTGLLLNARRYRPRKASGILLNKFSIRNITLAFLK